MLTQPSDNVKDHILGTHLVVVTLPKAKLVFAHLFITTTIFIVLCICRPPQSK